MRHDKNERFFDTWSAPMAYILGYLTADGHVNEKLYTLEFKIHPQDISILEFIKNNIAPTAPIKDRPNKAGDYFSIQKRLRISSKYIINSLVTKYKLRHDKTGNEFMPDVPIEFLSDYIRGVFDGDGCVGSYSLEPLTCNIVSSSCTFLEQMRNSMNNIGYIAPHSKIKRNFWQWKMSYIPAIIFRDFIYNNPCFALERKRIKFYSFRKPRLFRFTPEEDKVLIDYKEKYGHINARKLGFILNRNPSCISYRVKSLGIYKKGDLNGNHFHGIN